MSEPLTPIAYDSVDGVAPNASARPAIPELFFGMVSAVGTPLDGAEAALRELLLKRGYQLQKVLLKDMPLAVNPPTLIPATGASEFTRISTLMTRGNETRELAQNDSALAGLAIAEASGRRPDPATNAHAVLFRQLKHPEEAYLFRQVYDDGFHLIGCHCEKAKRKALLQVRGMTQGEADSLIERDEHEDDRPHGQRVRKTFPLSDVFVRITGDAETDLDRVNAQLKRFLDLLFGDGLHTPTRDEFGMYLAAAGALRSGQLSRQVGATILTPWGDLLAVGTNEVPGAQGGAYWEGDPDDARDHVRGIDSTDEMRDRILVELLDHALPKWRDARTERQTRIKKRLQQVLDPTRIMNLTEFTRAVHAEMDAILSAGRAGVSVVGATLYTTTFPCHNCMKHIIASGIARVVYIEPYPKSMALDLHGDAIQIDPPPADLSIVERVAPGGRRPPLRVEPFVGIAPRRYHELFSMTTSLGKSMRRKDADGRPDLSAVGLRLHMPEDWYMQREAEVAKAYIKMSSTS